MTIYDGDKNDSTNFKTDKYLKINSCSFQNVSRGHVTIRKKGRIDYQIILLTKGDCRALHGEAIHTLTPGNIIIYAPNEEQLYSFPSDSSTIWCHFTGTVADEIMRDAELESGIYHIKPNKNVIDTFSKLVREFHTKSREGFACAALIELIDCISNAYYSPDEKKDYEAISPALAYINSNYNKCISLDTLADITGYSKSRFSHIFSETIGTTPKKYQNDIRMKISREMLTSTKYTIGDVAESCGFSDPLYFSRVFKKTYGISPTEYRKK